MTCVRAISLLGSGWLGLPLARQLVAEGYSVQVSTTTPGRLDTLKKEGMQAFLVDIADLRGDIQGFLEADVLVCNIPSKNHAAFAQLVDEIEKSSVTRVLFVSSTSVYANDAGWVSESGGKELAQSPLIQIESLFLNGNSFTSTVLRFGGLVGYSRHPGRFFANGCVVSDAGGRVNLIHRDDCINIICEIIRQNVWGQAFNCCADTHPTRKEFYRHVMRQAGRVAVFKESSDKVFKVIRNDKVKDVLNYRFVYPDLMDIDFNKAQE